MKVLSIKQMLNLYKLGLKISKTQFCWKGNVMTYDVSKNCYTYVNHTLADKSKCGKKSLDNMEVIPTLTFQEIYEYMPKDIYVNGHRYFLNLTYKELYFDNHRYTMCYSDIDGDGYLEVAYEFENKDMLVAAYDMLVWYLQNKKILNI